MLAMSARITDLPGDLVSSGLLRETEVRKLGRFFRRLVFFVVSCPFRILTFFVPFAVNYDSKSCF